MKRFANVLMVEDKFDYLEKVIWSEEGCVRLENIGIIYHKGRKNFPQYYRKSVYDSHTCAEWYPISRTEAISLANAEIEELEDELARAKRKASAF